MCIIRISNVSIFIASFVTINEYAKAFQCFHEGAFQTILFSNNFMKTNLYQLQTFKFYI